MQGMMTSGISSVESLVKSFSPIGTTKPKFLPDKSELAANVRELMKDYKKADTLKGRQEVLKQLKGST